MQSQRTHTHIPAREPLAPWHKAEPRTVSVVSHQAPSLESWGWGPQKVFGSVGSRWLKSLLPASRHDADPVPYQDWHRTPASMNSDGAKWPPCPWASGLSIRLQHPCFPLSSVGSSPPTRKQRGQEWPFPKLLGSESSRGRPYPREGWMLLLGHPGLLP